MKEIKGGLKEKTEDKRDLKVGAIFSLPALKDIPVSFKLENIFTAKNQADSDFCSAYSRVGMSQLQEGVELSPKIAFGFSKYLTKDPDEWGQQMRDAMKASVKLGDVEKNDEPIDLSFDSARRVYERPDFEELKKKAEKHKKQTYFDATGQYNSFDDLRATIWKFRDKKVAVAIGIKFNYPLSDIVLRDVVEDGFGHMLYVYGWEGDYLLVRNSYGPEAGRNGDHLIHRDIINKWVPIFGAMCLLDMPREEAEYRRDNKIKENDWWIVGVFKALLWSILSTFRRA